jgi:hypothetical protein
MDGLSLILSGFADLLNKECRFIPSARLQGYVHALVTRIELPMPKPERSVYEATAVELKAVLGEQAYMQAYEEGRAYSQAEAVEIALQGPGASAASRPSPSF